MKVPVPYSSSVDRRVWTASSSEHFSVSLAFHELREAKPSSFMYRQVWHPHLPQKISFFMMRLLRGRLPLDDILTKLFLHLPSKCFCCVESSVETRQHVFMDGEVARAIWKFFGSLCGITFGQDHLRVYLANWWYKPTKSERLKFVFRLLPIFVCWNLWKARNSAVFEGITKDA